MYVFAIFTTNNVPIAVMSVDWQEVDMCGLAKISPALEMKWGLAKTFRHSQNKKEMRPQ